MKLRHPAAFQEANVASGFKGSTGALGRQTIQKLRIRLLPFMFLLYFVSYLDRTNIGFAALTMNKELAITSDQFGLVAGVFFFGYFLFEIPSNLLLHRIGARIWIARILLSWGALAAATGFAHSVSQLYVLRFLLGLAEAGYFPGMVLYLTYWFPERERARAVALFLTGLPVTMILGAPISGLILDRAHWFGVSSWRWLLILEGIPAVILGVLTYFVLPSHPRDATFLTADEKEWIRAELEREKPPALQQHALQQQHLDSALQGLANARVWHLVVIYAGMMIGSYSLTIWAPQIMKLLPGAFSNSAVGLLLAIPYLVGLVAMVVLARSSDRMLERRYHVAIPAMMAAAALVLLGTTSSTFYSVALLALVVVGVVGTCPPFWALPCEFLTGASAASGIALINSVGNLGGFIGPYTIGAVAARTGSLYRGLAIAGACLFLSAVLVLFLPREARRPTM